MDLVIVIFVCLSLVVPRLLWLLLFLLYFPIIFLLEIHQSLNSILSWFKMMCQKTWVMFTESMGMDLLVSQWNVAYRMTVHIMKMSMAFKPVHLND